MMITFDESLPLLIDIVVDAWGANALATSLFLRDALGRLTLIVLDFGKTGAEREMLSKKINKQLGGYTDLSGISVATPEELFDESLRETGIGLALPVNQTSFQGIIRIVDRRIVGGDWLRRPAVEKLKVPRLFFISLKGGVGRSTALCVLAVHLATAGRRVLAIDLDLEAPGLGTMLLDKTTLPRFGLLDYLVESNLTKIEDEFFGSMLGFSQLSGGRGSITVVPALGMLASDSPVNVLGKLARAYLPSDNDPSLSGFTAKIEKLLDCLTATGDYDVVLVDARAGLHESTAAAAVALQGDILFFGMDQPQTFAGYGALLAQQALTLGKDWAARVHFVEARVGANGPSTEFISNMVEILPTFYNSELSQPIALDELRGTFDLSWSEEDFDLPSVGAEISSTFIYESDLFFRFNPLKHPDRINKGVYTTIYGDFLKTCEEILSSTDDI